MMTDNSTQAAKATADQVEVELLAKREKIYPRAVTGAFARLRVLAVWTLLGLYYGVPWLNWDGQQAVLFDLPDRRFYLFGITFWPQDFFYMASLLIIAALALFFFTALAGRLWCGYSCPQTVWTEVFLWIERKIEGDRPRQIRLDKAPWTAHKILLKGSKHLIWLLFSLFTGLTFVGYFSPIRELAVHVATFSLGPWESFWILFYGFATYGNAGWLREQVCLYMCPYARFQSAMLDKDTLIISYDAKRGEPRGPRRRGEDYKAKGLGDCINCQMCVQVCPTGIDIRDGLQYECIGCAACIDICDQVMEKMGYPKGLIRYTTENALEGKPAHLLRPRVVIYGLLLLGLTGALVYSIMTRIPLDVDVMRDRNALYRETDEGMVENIYTVKVMNKDSKAHRFHLAVSGLEGARLIAQTAEFRIASGEAVDLPVRVEVDPAELRRTSSEVDFEVAAEDGPELRRVEKARFLGPVSR